MITVYSKEGCPHCVQAKALLAEWDIDFEEIRIDLDDSAREFVISEGHRSVPQLYIGDELLVEGGFAGLRTLDPYNITRKVEIHENRKR